MDNTTGNVPNLDAMEPEELMSFWFKYQKGASRADCETLFGGRFPGFTRVANDLANYASNKATAIGCRKRGEIATALQYENIADRIYDGLPTRARW